MKTKFNLKKFASNNIKTLKVNELNSIIGAVIQEMCSNSNDIDAFVGNCSHSHDTDGKQS